MLPVVFGKEGKWHIASCPLLDIATQGLTDQEARENITALIRDYLSDPDTAKPDFTSVSFPSLSYIEVAA